MAGSPLHRFGGLGSFDGVDEFEDGPGAPRGDADDRADDAGAAPAPRKPRWSEPSPTPTSCSRT